MSLTPMRLLRIPEPFDHPDSLFEPKPDGCRALAHVRGHRCDLVSRKGQTLSPGPATKGRRNSVVLAAATSRC